MINLNSQIPVTGNWFCSDLNETFSGTLYQENNSYYLKITTTNRKSAYNINLNLKQIQGLRFYNEKEQNQFIELFVEEKSLKSSNTFVEFVFIVAIILQTNGKPSNFYFTNFELVTSNVNLIHKRNDTYPRIQPSNISINHDINNHNFSFQLKTNKTMFLVFLDYLHYIESLFFIHYSFPIEFHTYNIKNGTDTSQVILNIYQNNIKSQHQQPIEFESLANFTKDYLPIWEKLFENKVFVDVIYNLISAILVIEETGYISKFKLLPIQQSYEGLYSALNLANKSENNIEINKTKLNQIKEAAINKAKEIGLNESLNEAIKSKLSDLTTVKAHDKILTILKEIPEEKLIIYLKTNSVDLPNKIQAFIKDFSKQRNYLNHFSKNNFFETSLIEYHTLISILFQFINTYLESKTLNSPLLKD